MIYNIFKFFILMFIISFFIFVFNYYFSEKNINQVKKNRNNFELNVQKNFPELPILSNNTNNVIEFNSGFDDTNKNKLKRSFWDLFK